MTKDGPGPDFDYGSIKPGYYDLVYRRRSGAQSKWHHLKFARIREEMGSYHSHLDIGCGAGTLIGSLTSDSPSVGVDIAPDQIRYAEATYGEHNRQFKRIEPGVLPFDDATFDVITLVDIVEHLTHEENRRLLSEAYRVLQPGGRVIALTVDFAGVWPVVEWLVNKLGDVSYAHQHILHFDRVRLEQLLKLGNLTNTRVKGFQLLAPFSAVLGWRTADLVDRLEPGWLVSRFGLYMLATGEKSGQVK